MEDCCCKKSAVHLEYLTTDKPYDPAVEPANYDSFEFVSEGCQIHGQIMWPDGSFTQRPCVLLLHGYPGSARNDDLAHALCRIGCVVITPHFRGAWGSEGKYLVSNCLADTINLANYVRSPEFCDKYHTDPENIYLIGHSMGGCCALSAGRKLPWLRGLVLMTPYDSCYYLRKNDRNGLMQLLNGGTIMAMDGPDAVEADIEAHFDELDFPSAFENVKNQNLLFLTADLDPVAPWDYMVKPLWELLESHETCAVQRQFAYPADHGLIGSRMKVIADIAQFLADTAH